MRSTSFRSMTTLRDVAVEQHAAAVRDDVDVLAGARAEEQHRVDAVLTFDRVVAVARIPLEHVVAGAHERDVVAVVAEDEVIAVAAEQRVRALAAEDRVVARAAVDRQLHDAGRQRGRGDRVVATQTVDDERVVRAFAVGHIDPCGQADHRHRRAGADHVDVVVAVRGVRDDRVGLAVARRAADRAGEIDVDLDDVGAAQIVDRERVRAAERVEVDGLDVVEIHDDVAEVAREQHAAAVRRGGEDLAAGAAVEQHRVGAVLAFDDVAAVARIPLEHVVAGADQRNVVALLAVDEVIAVAADQQIHAVAAQDRVVAGAAVDRHADQRREVAGRGEACRCRRPC